MTTNPYLNAPLTPTRPKMFASTLAKVVWTLVPIVSISLAAAVPFVVAAEVLILTLATALDPQGDSPFAGMLLILLIVTAATHTALLDNDKITIGT